PRAFPTFSPEPGTMLSTPAGTPACDANSVMRIALSEVSFDGFTTTLLPTARAGATFQANIRAGKFHGKTAATTPTGSRTIRPRCPGPVGATEWNSLSAASAYQRKHLMVSGTS